LTGTSAEKEPKEVDGKGERWPKKEGKKKSKKGQEKGPSRPKG